MSVFIEVQIKAKRCVGIADCGKCVQVCPVNIFNKIGNDPVIVNDNEDECLLCDFCLNECNSRMPLLSASYTKNKYGQTGIGQSVGASIGILTLP